MSFYLLPLLKNVLSNPSLILLLSASPEPIYQSHLREHSWNLRPVCKGLLMSSISGVIWRFSKMFRSPSVFNSSFLLLLLLLFHYDDFFHEKKTDPNFWMGRITGRLHTVTSAQGSEEASEFWAVFSHKISHLPFLTLTYLLAYSLNVLWCACQLQSSHAGHEIMKSQFLWVWIRL